jgi:hypothetical protein
LAKAQLTGSAHLGGDETRVQEGEFDAKGVEFGVVAKGVANVGHVAGGPVRHGGGPWRKKREKKAVTGFFKERSSMKSIR